MNKNNKTFEENWPLTFMNFHLNFNYVNCQLSKTNSNSISNKILQLSEKQAFSLPNGSLFDPK